MMTEDERYYAVTQYGRTRIHARDDEQAIRLYNHYKARSKVYNHRYYKLVKETRTDLITHSDLEEAFRVKEPS